MADLLRSHATVSNASTERYGDTPARTLLGSTMQQTAVHFTQYRGGRSHREVVGGVGSRVKYTATPLPCYPRSPFHCPPPSQGLAQDVLDTTPSCR